MTPQPDADRAGFLRVLAATAVVGVAGYVITWLVPRTIGTQAYTTFAVFWSFTFLLAAGLSGIQQEVTRATHSVPAAEPGPRPRMSAVMRFGIVSALLVAGLALASAPLWGSSIFVDHSWELVPPLAIGASSYVLLAVLTGTLYGISHWMALFWAILTEGVLRLVLIVSTLSFTTDDVALAWAVALPFPITFLIIWLVYRRRLAGRTRLDVGYRTLTWNVARTLLASLSMGVLVSGFPLLIGITTPAPRSSDFGVILLLVVLVRAPLIVVGMALQSYLVVMFRKAAEAYWRPLWMLLGGVAAAGVVIGAAAWLWGPAVFSVLFPAEVTPSASFMAALAGSSAVLGCLCASAPATLARARHGMFSLGWLLAAVVSVSVLLLPLDVETRTIAALVVGPACGLTLQLVGLGLERARSE